MVGRKCNFGLAQVLMAQIWSQDYRSFGIKTYFRCIQLRFWASCMLLTLVRMVWSLNGFESENISTYSPAGRQKQGDEGRK